MQQTKLTKGDAVKLVTSEELIKKLLADGWKKDEPKKAEPKNKKAK